MATMAGPITFGSSPSSMGTRAVGGGWGRERLAAERKDSSGYTLNFMGKEPERGQDALAGKLSKSCPARGSFKRYVKSADFLKKYCTLRRRETKTMSSRSNQLVIANYLGIRRVKSRMQRNAERGQCRCFKQLRRMREAAKAVRAGGYTCVRDAWRSGDAGT
jgi:hypothetical protein